MDATLTALPLALLTIPAPGRPEGKTIRVTRIGRGRYTTAWRHGSRVYLRVRPGEHSKEILETLRGKAHIPSCRFVAHLPNDYKLYGMPLYRRVTARETTEAWKQLRTLIKMREDAWLAARDRNGGRAHGYDINAAFADLLDNTDHGLPDSLVNALNSLLDQAMNYGEYVVEFRRANVAATKSGKLILLDPLFDMEEVRNSQKKRDKWAA